MDDPNIIMEEYIRLEEETDRRRGKVYNWETVTYGKICYFDDLDFFKDFENEFLAIVCNDALTSKSDFLTESTINIQHIDEFNLKDETSLYECDEEEQNVLYFNDVFLFNVIYPDDSKSDTDNDNDKINIDQSSWNLSVKPLPDVINTDVGAYAQGSNKLLETSHDKSNKIFKAETFIKELNDNIMTWNHLNKRMSFIFLIKILYVPFGIPFDTKLFYKDGIKLGTVHTTYSLNEYNIFDTGINTVYPGKFPNIPKRIEEDYQYIKDDVPLVSVYTTRNVSVRGMLIPDAFLTAEIRETNDFKEYETVFMKVAILMNQPQQVVSTQGTNRNTPRAHRSPTISANPLEKKKRKQTAGESSSPRKIIKQKKQSTPSIPPPRDDRKRDAIAKQLF
ncbi:hypothetical protein Tco_1053782 [Tanacetum coccineum]|uniref:Uncharacterized protein n=1 Tax=Tanacetum coccineum TaxID=301880 RepID=A0ABQ5GWH2_9ASTR